MIIGIDGASPRHLESLLDDLQGRWRDVADSEETIQYIINYIREIKTCDFDFRHDLRCFQTFLPPRVVAAGKRGHFVPFFGAGISAPAGVPLWGDLLEKFQISRELTALQQDPNLDNDPLTLAELLAHEIGTEKLQRELRGIMTKPKSPAIVHYLLAYLSQPIYITTNYDTLFERAWVAVHGGEKPVVIKNDADLERYGLSVEGLAPVDRRPLLFKIHGCAEEDDEELILTRSQYRRHYRTNRTLFDALQHILSSRHTLFLGFSHRDPEINRQVDDVIYEFEKALRKARDNEGEEEKRIVCDDKSDNEDNANPEGMRHPALYSLQFDMKERTPEIFAARGLVALKPALALDAPDRFDYRTAGVTQAIVDMAAAMDSEAHTKLDLDNALDTSVLGLRKCLEEAMREIAVAASEVQDHLADENAVEAPLRTLCKALGSFAGQGVYLLNAGGDIIRCELPHGLEDPRRKDKRRLHDRFYFRQAKTYRQPFVSDTDRSVFNGQSTFFLCHPLGHKSEFRGLLFSAAQVGFWRKPLDLKEELRKRDPKISFVLVDSNGVALLPPNEELDPEPPPLRPKGEETAVNLGFDFEALHQLSRRDRLISRIWRNIVPLAQDDDVESFADLEIYSVVAEIEPARWKLALSKPLPTRRRAR